jgi:DNA repair photolyase
MLKVIYQPAGRAAEYNPWAANLYRGCGHRCIYCYAPSALKMSREEFDKPAPRQDVIAKLTKDGAELKGRGEFHKILMCFSCDPCQPVNDEYHLTEQSIEILHFYGQSVSLLTKGGFRALPSIALLKQGDEFGITLTCTDKAQSNEWEPGAASPSERIDTLKEANSRGIFTWVSLEPVLYPEQSLAIIDQTHDFVSKYKLGTLNYNSHAKTINWSDYAQRAITLVQKYGNDYYVKDDLKKHVRS